MAKLQYQCTMSLDGFIAGPDGDMSWLADHLGPNPTVDEIMEQTGALLVGNNTFGGDDPYKGTEHQGEPYGGGWDGPQFVVTHHVPADQGPGVTFLDDLGAAISAAKAAVGDKYVGVLGASIARQCLEAGELDEIFVSVAPVLLGDGIRLFDHPGGRNVRLETMRVAEVPSATNIQLRVVR
ncbi:dihydrofolate reductase family protein [Actinomadura sp. DC4]|uniref:dihydrofolate reductase family protein n=1 Tax=Actinomadura sp. DC4 TaxID=3055069 RepID=UPI0025AF360E|nr:dihydrofolate reductase family protein [Actinomadura sp. DC4]MDN3354713.1 dihydrofolate reductase family protein [Actinomadura sp. DC4]